MGAASRRGGRRVRFNGMDAESDHGEGLSSTRERRQRGARARGVAGGSPVTEEMSREFGRLLDPSACRAKIWIPLTQGAHPEWLNVLRQCGKPCVAGQDLCRQHLRKAPVHTKIGEVLPQHLYE